MRVTQQQITASTLANIQASFARTAKLQEQQSSGKVLNRASDSPSDMVTSLALRGEIGQNERYAKNAADASAWLANVESAVTATQRLLSNVRDLTLSAASSGNNDVAARAAIATQVASLRKELLEQANTTFAGRPIFGGATAGGKAFDTTGTYVGGTGDDRTVDRRLDATTVMEVGASGQDLYGDGPDSAFALLDAIEAHAKSDPAALQADLVKLDARLSAVSQVHTDVGVRANRAETAVTTADYRADDLRQTLSGVEDIDLPKTILALQAQEVSHQAALSAASKVLSPTLMDFLK